jgi:hypothetical protein
MYSAAIRVENVRSHELCGVLRSESHKIHGNTPRRMPVSKDLAIIQPEVTNYDKCGT